MKPLLFRLGGLAVSFALALLALEILVRCLPFFPVTAMGAVMRRDEILDHSLRPHARGRMKSREYDVTYRINSVGLRDIEPSEGAVMLLGDSFMEGYGVPQDRTTAARLRERGWKVVNAGVKSYSPLLELLYLRHRGLALEPDTVVLFLDLSDPANDAYYLRRLVTDSSGPLRIRPRESSLWNPDGENFLERHSVLFQYALHALYKYFPATREDIGYAGQADGVDVLFTGRDAIPDTAYYGAEWKICLESILAVRDLCAGRHVAFLLATYPYGHQVSSDAWAEGRKGHKFPPGVSSDRPFRFVERWAATESIPVLSLDRAFRAHPEPGRLYFNWDGHWTEFGHELVAEELHRTLAAM